MGADQIVDRLQRHGAGPDLVGEGRQADLDAFLRVAFGLPVQVLVLAELLEQHHRQKVWAGRSPWRGVEERWWLADLYSPSPPH